MTPDSVTLDERYVLESRIASGGMATVWRARDDVLARAVAVKIMHPHLASDEGFVERFRREALAAARLAHPNIVSIYDTGTEGREGAPESHYIVMEYCGNGTLQRILQEHGFMQGDRATEVGIDICDALGYAHSNGVIHRDIKPANVLISENSIIKVADFGIAKAAFGKGDITTTGSILGTVTYLSPEQVRGEEPDLRSDLYSVGILLYELIAGRPPFVEESQIALAMKHVNEPPPPLRAMRAGVPRALEAVVMRALEKDPAARYPSAEEMRSALDETHSKTAFFERSPATPPETVAAPRPAPTSASPARTLILPLALAAVAIALVILVPLLVDGSNENGDGRGGGDDGTGSALQVIAAEPSDFDPHGDGEEHSEDIAAAVDGDRATSWSTESYSSALELIKPGVGLVFDLGSARDVERVTVISPTPGYSVEVMASGELPSDEGGFEEVASSDDAGAEESFEVGGASGRYWLVWITAMPGGGGGSASLAEVEFRGP